MSIHSLPVNREWDLGLGVSIEGWGKDQFSVDFRNKKCLVVKILKWSDRLTTSLQAVLHRNLTSSNLLSMVLLCNIAKWAILIFNSGTPLNITFLG
jgi:hypothetical protein